MSVRHCVIIVDYSASALRTDFLPSRAHVIRSTLESFIDVFLSSNALSYVGLIVTSDGEASWLCPLSISAEKLKGALVELVQSRTPSGAPSIENALHVLLTCFAQGPTGGPRREVVYISCGLHTVDPGDVFHTIDAVVAAGITVNVLSFGGHMHVLSALASRTGGEHYVPLHERHLTEILQSLCGISFSSSRGNPLPQVPTSRQPLIALGFPIITGLAGEDASLTLCACHGKLTKSGISCPRCHARLCELPCTCAVCGLSLVPSAHVARTLYQMRRRDNCSLFVGLEESDPAPLSCDLCGTYLSGSVKGMEWQKCMHCDLRACGVCGRYVKERLAMCPGCE